MRMVDLPHAKEISEEEGCVKVGRWLRGNDYGPAAPSGFPPKENGWFCNLFYEKNVPYVWRSNERCTKARLLNGLRSVLRRMNVPFPVLVFHENHGGWRALCNPTRFLELESLDAATPQHLGTRLTPAAGECKITEWKVGLEGVRHGWLF